MVELHGLAYSTPDQIGVRAGGVTYDVPLDVPWKAADGSWHEDKSRPSCLPPSSTQLHVTFGAVRWKHGLGSNTVAWVDCSR